MDEQLYLMAVGLSLEEKVHKAIENLRQYEKEALKRDPDNGYMVCDSYGKDSCIIVDLAERAGVRFQASHNFTTLDPPELIRFGRKHHASTVELRPERALLWMVAHEWTTLPTRRIRKCCADYKESGHTDKVKVFGVRAAESVRRKTMWRVWQPHKSRQDRSGGGGGWILNPILYWTDDDVWRYIHDNNVPYCSLYDEGAKRLGCVGCPMSARRAEEFVRWPKYEEAWRRAIYRFWDRMHSAKRKDGKPYVWARFESPDELWRWWMEELLLPAEDDCQMGLF